MKKNINFTFLFTVSPKCENLFKCMNSSICIDPEKRCDGFAQCPLFDDEYLCNKTCPENCTCDGLYIKCSSFSSTIAFPSDVRKLDLSTTSLESTNVSLREYILLIDLNVSSAKLSDLRQIDISKSHNMQVLDLSYNIIESIPKFSFEGLVRLRKLLLDGNNVFNVFTHSFNGLRQLPNLILHKTTLTRLTFKTFVGLSNLDVLNITSNKIEEIENGAFEGLSTLKILDIRGNRITKFSADIFKGIDNLEKILSDAFVFCCLRPSSVKEENCVPTRDEFSSCEDMMRNNILRVCLWVIGIAALVGNFIVLSYRFIYDRGSLQKGHGIFVSSLGIADLLMGIYMLMIASADVMFRGVYVWNDFSWRYGTTCKIAGILSTFSSECSVMFLFMITIDRFIAVKYPFGEIRFGKWAARWISLGVICICFLIAIIPLIPGSYFDGDFYSRSAVCLALPLTRDKPKGWEYSFGIFIVFNFLLFLVIAVFQLVIYREVKMSMGRVRSTQKRKDLTIARNLFLVVFSDFLCWFPVGVMGKTISILSLH